eukprot:SM000001S04608  [mRNA]  locus=s1:1197047:1204629:+ [translate_table: standard]
MTHCVLDWDMADNDDDIGGHPGDGSKEFYGLQTTVKGKWVSIQHRKPFAGGADHHSNRITVPEMPLADIAAAAAAAQHPPPPPPIPRDDDMETWLQYQLVEDPFEQSYCSELFGELPPPSAAVGKDAFLSTQAPVMAPSGAGTASASTSTCSDGSGAVGGGMAAPSPSSREATASAAMALGAQRAAGLISSSGAEVFHRVRTTTHSAVPTPQPRCGGDAMAASPSLVKAKSGTSSEGLAPGSMAPPARALPLNFSHFSRPAAIYGRALQSFGVPVAGSGGPSSRFRSGGGGGGAGNSAKAASSNSSMAESTIISSSSTEPLKSAGAMSSEPQGGAGGGGGGVTGGGSGGGGGGGSGAGGGGGGGGSGVGVAAFKSSEQQAGSKRSRDFSSMDAGTLEAGDAEPSEDVDEDTSDVKKPTTSRGNSSSAAKRSRAAEVHNLSERRRRDRINERMKALQELIPNSNKTDKASMLDEAIEYLKMLQAQLQVMSMRSGMGIPPMLMPTMPMGAMAGMGLSGVPVGPLGMGHMPQGQPPSSVGVSQVGMGLMEAGAVLGHPPLGPPPSQRGGGGMVDMGQLRGPLRGMDPVQPPFVDLAHLQRAGMEMDMAGPSPPPVATARPAAMHHMVMGGNSGGGAMTSGPPRPMVTGSLPSAAAARQMAGMVEAVHRQQQQVLNDASRSTSGLSETPLRGGSAGAGAAGVVDSPGPFFARHQQLPQALSRIAANRLQKELVEWQVNPPAGFQHRVTDNLQRWIIDVVGAPGTLYSNEQFHLQVDFPEHYPMEAPQVIFVQNPPLHPHIYSNGHICLDILYDSWSPAMTVSSICISILSMLSSATVKMRPPDNDRYVKNCRHGRSPKETRWWFHDDTV